MNIKERLFELRDEEYAKFQSNLTPGFDASTIIGVRVPVLRKLAKEIIKSGEYTEFISALPHDYYDENMLHGIIISEIKDYDKCIEELDKFLPYADNWAVCDIMSPKIFKKNKDKLMNEIVRWSESEHTYTSRFGIEMLMSHYLDDEFKEEYLEIPVKALNEEYYIKMMVAWFFATALAKQWDSAIPYIENNRLAKWTHNKTIQKAIESYRVSDEHKAYLRTLRVR